MSANKLPVLRASRLIIAQCTISARCNAKLFNHDVVPSGVGTRTISPNFGTQAPDRVAKVISVRGGSRGVRGAHCHGAFFVTRRSVTRVWVEKEIPEEVKPTDNRHEPEQVDHCRCVVHLHRRSVGSAALPRAPRHGREFPRPMWPTVQLLGRVEAIDWGLVEGEHPP
jgi:hypothetical protein